MAIIIPADLTIVTLRDGGRELPQRWTAEHAVAVLRQASNLLKGQADIEFHLGACEEVVDVMPSGGAPDALDEAGYDVLASAYTAGDGVRVLLVDRVSGPEPGVHAWQPSRVCALAWGADLGAASRMMAHGLGHLLSLPHVDSGRASETSRDNRVAAWTKNLMYSGPLSSSAALTPTQVRAARSSPLARRFGGR